LWPQKRGVSKVLGCKTTMTYSVKEIFLTLQGEGMRAGRLAVFCRFSGCNLWSGKEEDRSNAICNFCDTDFVGVDGTLGGKYSTAIDLASAISQQWPTNKMNKYVVLTGGEPLLQVDSELVDALHARDFEIAVETNGTIDPPHGIDWLTVSPKSISTWKVKAGNEMKLVFPQTGVKPEHVEESNFDFFYLQPLDGTNAQHNTRSAIDFCQKNPKWRLSLQTHKLLGIR
jgi:7-carboxy-7-deazaguanine synthase